MAPSSVVGSTTAKEVDSSSHDTRLKTPLPDNFSGDRTKFKAFVTQLDVYMALNLKQFPTEQHKAIWATTFLRGQAFDWVEVFLKDHLAKGADSKERKVETRKMFDNFDNFKKRMSRMFGDIDEVGTAERAISALKQTGSASNYAAMFQQYAGRIKWAEDALLYQYYKGLKGEVKDDIVRAGKPDDLQELISDSIRIDNRLYERRLEDKGLYRHQFRNSGKNKKKEYWPQPMEVDATYKGKQKPKLSKDEMDRRRKFKLCFECGKPGHMASIHRGGNGRKQLHATGRKAGPPRQICATRRNDMNPDDYDSQLSEWEVIGPIELSPEDEEEFQEELAKALLSLRNETRYEVAGPSTTQASRFQEEKTWNVAHMEHVRHKELTWLACYTNECTTHLQEKKDNWFPKEVNQIRWKDSQDCREANHEIMKNRYEELQAELDSSQEKGRKHRERIRKRQRLDSDDSQPSKN
jgi:hypothetical protein